MKKLFLLSVLIFVCGLVFPQANTKNFSVNINQLSSTDTSFYFPFLENVAWSVDIITDTANITSGTSGSIDVMQSENEYDRMWGRSIDFGSLNIYQLPATLDSLSPLIIIKDEDWSGKIFCIKVIKGTLSGNIPIKIIFTYNYLATKQQ